MRIRVSIVIAALLASTSAVVTQTAPSPSEYGTQTGQRIRVTRVASGLVHPWSIAFVDARTMLIAEQPGRLRVVRDGDLLPAPAWEAPKPPMGNDALHFVAVHPQITQTGFVYLS